MSSISDPNFIYALSALAIAFALLGILILLYETKFKFRKYV
ncbi:MAG: hypothetical protein N3F64_02980 [Nitrososphaeria archaeon]|nr:hypothetical protein [Nitrososphaeria archaeon]